MTIFLVIAKERLVKELDDYIMDSTGLEGGRFRNGELSAAKRKIANTLKEEIVTFIDNTIKKNKEIEQCISAKAASQDSKKTLQLKRKEIKERLKKDLEGYDENSQKTLDGFLALASEKASETVKQYSGSEGTFASLIMSLRNWLKWFQDALKKKSLADTYCDQQPFCVVRHKMAEYFSDTIYEQVKAKTPMALVGHVVGSVGSMVAQVMGCQGLSLVQLEERIDKMLHRCGSRLGYLGLDIDEVAYQHEEVTILIDELQRLATDTRVSVGTSSSWTASFFSSPATTIKSGDFTSYIQVTYSELEALQTSLPKQSAQSVAIPE